jgi:hypothetical protein
MTRGNKRLEKNTVSITATGLSLGENVSNFFDKRNINHASIIIDYKNNSIIIWGEKGTTRDPSSHYNGTGLRIFYPNYANTLTVIKARIERIINFMFSNKYLAKPLNDHSVIIENVELNKRVILASRMFFDFEKKIIIMGNFNIGNNLTSEDLIRKQNKSVNEYEHVNDKATVGVSEPKVE